jgi:hypothetical protein
MNVGFVDEACAYDVGIEGDRRLQRHAGVYGQERAPFHWLAVARVDLEGVVELIPAG